MQGVKTKAKVQETYSDTKKFTSTNYNAWEALDPLQIEHQLTTHYGYKHRWDLKNAYKYKQKMLDYAEQVVPLIKSRPTPQDS